MSRKQQNGFTLIELMITVAIVAILAAIAYPSYQSQIRKSKRAAAEAYLMEAAAKEHQFMVDVRSYTATLSDLPAVPSDISGAYTFTVSTPSATSFLLTGTPIGNQTADSCGTLTIDQAGSKNPTTSGCW